MLTPTAAANCRTERRRGPIAALVIVLLAAAAASAQTQQNNPPAAAPQRPAVPTTAPAARRPANSPAPPLNLNQTLNNLNNAAHLPANRLASLNTSQSAAGRAVQSQMFLGHPGPAGSNVARAPNGNLVRTAADGSVIDVRSPAKGMYIQHGLDGSKRILVEQPDHSRIFATSRGVPYVQHPYVFRGRPIDHRTFYVQGKLFHQFYRPYNYGGTQLDVYAPTRFYDPKFYQFVTTPFNAPQPFAWGYTSAPWYGYYKGYFTPDSTYSSPQAWLTDFVLAASLAVAYTTAPPTAPPPSAAAAPAVTPQVKQLVAQEVDHQVKEESVEAQANAQSRDLPPGSGSVVQELGDHQPHVFVAASDLDLVDPSGRRCSISEGDVVQVVSAPNAGTSTADAVVLASKGGGECERSAQVQVAVSDLQEMQNHMRETIDMGMAASDPGKKAAAVPAAFAASAPPPDANAAREIEQQQQIAAAVEG